MKGFFMNRKNPSLKEMLIEDLPAGFVNELIDDIESVYTDSHAAMFNDPELGVNQAKTVLGHYRRSRAETLLERLAVKHGLKAETVQPVGGGCTHVSVHVGRFELVMCHVISRDAFPQHSDDREQSSKANECLSQMDWLEESVVPGEGEFYGIIIHTEVAGVKNKLGSIKIGFPNHEWDEWIEEPIDMIEISEIQKLKGQGQEDLQGFIQDEKARPKLKEGSKQAKKKGA
jgi:hypothetical protein